MFVVLLEWSYNPNGADGMFSPLFFHRQILADVIVCILFH